MSDFARVARLRRRLGVDPTPFAPLPLFKPRCRARWYLLANEVRHAEAELYDRLDREMLELERLALLVDVER